MQILKIFNILGEYAPVTLLEAVEEVLGLDHLGQLIIAKILAMPRPL